MHLKVLTFGFVLVLLSLFSCSKTAEPISFSFQEHNIKVTVLGKQSFSGEPYDVTVNLLKNNEPVYSVVAQAWVWDLTKENVSCECNSADVCYVYIEQRDGQKISVPLPAF